MASYTGYVSSSGKDWDYLGTNLTTLTFRRTTDGSGVPTVDDSAYAIMDTSFVAGKTITAVTFYWKHNTNDSAKLMRVGVWNGTNYNTDVYIGNGGAANAWKSTGITDTNVINCINSSGGSETSLVFITNHTTPSLTRTHKIYSYDSGSTVAPQVVIEYNDPVVASTRRRPFIIT